MLCADTGLLTSLPIIETAVKERNHSLTAGRQGRGNGLCWHNWLFDLTAGATAKDQ